jgi:hypothetical protein
MSIKNEDHCKQWSMMKGSGAIKEVGGLQRRASAIWKTGFAERTLR